MLTKIIANSTTNAQENIMLNINNVTIFNFRSHNVRTILKDGEPWFIAKDVCDVLEIANSRDAVSRIPDKDKMTVGLTDSHSGQRGGARSLTIISEAGLYRLVLRSDKPAAEPFIDWVTSEVLPTIRKTGSYGNISLPQTYEEALEELLKRVKAERVLKEKSQKLIAENTELREKNLTQGLTIAHNRDNVRFALAVRQSESTCLVGTLANYLKQNGYKTGPVKFFEYLRNEGWLCKQKGEAWNRPTKKALDSGFFKIKMNAYTKGQSEEIGVTHTPVLTMKGMQFFVQKLLSQTLDNPLTDSVSGSEK